MKLEKKIAIITGASSRKGIGRAIAEAFAKEGAVIVAIDVQDPAETVNHIQKNGGEAIGITLDVCDRKAAIDAINVIKSKFGRIDILVNNAGICSFRSFLDIDDELWDRTFEVNVKGYFILGQLVSKCMIQDNVKGKIINMSSISSEISGEGKVHYCATKAAVSSLTQGMAIELAKYGINVNAIAPGTIDTDIVKEEAILKMVEEQRDNPAGIPMGRFGIAGDIAGAAVFLTSRDSDYMTGATIRVDGGMLAGTMLSQK